MTEIEKPRQSFQMAKVKSKKRKMNHEYKNEVQSEVTAISLKRQTFYDFKGQESPLLVLPQEMQHVNDYTPTSLQPISYDNFAYFTGKESIF